MASTPAQQHGLWIQLAAGFAAGVTGVALLALLVAAVSLGLGGTLLVVIQTGFGGSGLLAALMVASGLLIALGGATLLWWCLQRWLLPALVAHRPVGARRWIGAMAGGALGLGMGSWAVPAPIMASAMQIVTGRNEQQRAGRPALQSGRLRLHDVLAVHPEGPELALVAAVTRLAVPAGSPGRLLTKGDLQLQVDALRQLLPTVPPAWQAVVLGTMAELQRGNTGGPPAEGPMSEALMDAGRAGSRAFLVLAAQHQEEIAQQLERNTAGASADVAWQRTLHAYAAAGATFEVARLYDESLPLRLRALPLPAGPAAPPSATDAVLSQRLWLLAQALGDDAVWDRARLGERDLAMAASLVALELAPAAAPLALVNPAQRWSTSPWALGRWIMALRHARGDCLAALALSSAARQRRRPATVNQPQPGASSLDLAWAVAWTEAAESCARTEEERQQVIEQKAQLDYLRFDPGVLDAARAGVAASLTVLR